MANDLRKKALEILTFKNQVFPKAAGKMALKFINGNFRSQSWEGRPWKKRRGGKRNARRAILVDTGALRRGNQMAVMPGAVRIFNDVPYAAAHNNGYYGTVSVKGHSRRIYGRFKVSSLSTRRTSKKRLESGKTSVKPHSRLMRIPRRQFAPTKERPSPTLNRSIRRYTQLEVLRILKK